MRRSMLDELGGLDAGFRLYGEDIDLAYRAAKAGWERWYVPDAVVRHDVRGGDRQALPHAATRSGTCAGCRASCASIPSGFASCDEGRSVRAQRRALDARRSTRPRAPISRHRADLIVSLGPPLEPGDVVLDLACGDGGLGAHLLARGLRYRGVDADARDGREAAPAPGARADGGARRPERLRPARAGRRDDVLPRDLLRAGPQAFFPHVAGYTDAKLVFDLNPRQYRPEDVLADLRAAGFARIELRPFFSPQRVALPRPLAAALRVAERSGPLARLALRFRFSYICAASR